MPDSGLMVLSFVSLLVGTALYLYPKALLKFGSALNRTIGALDDQLVRHRYTVGLLAFIASYAFFKLAILMPTIGH